jgi:hypothetical protein
VGNKPALYPSFFPARDIRQLCSFRVGLLKRAFIDAGVGVFSGFRQMFFVCLISQKTVIQLNYLAKMVYY